MRRDDLPTFYAQQLDPEAARIADFPSRDRAAFDEHWARIMADPALLQRSIVVDGSALAGNLVSWEHDGVREVGFWLGREFWGRGIATAALAAFLREFPARPIVAFVARGNGASRRVLEKVGFRVVGEDAVGYHLKLDAS